MQNFNLSMIDDPAVFKINVLPARSDTVICDKSGRPARLSLHGMWKFHYAENPSSAIAGFEQPDMDVSGWKEIPVPSNIQMEGYDAPAYVNSQYPWDGREDLATGQAPRIFNPTAQYVTFFEVPENWKNMGVRTGRKVFGPVAGAPDESDLGHRDAGRQSLGALGGVTHDKHRFAKARSFFLNAT